MSLHNLQERYSQFDQLVLKLMNRYGLTLLRVSVGVVFVWFGALKLFPGVSPAEPLIRGAITFLPMNIFLPFLACWEMLIGLGFITGKFQRLTIALMLAQMMGAMSPLVLRPDLIWKVFPFVWTLEGQYVFKDIILISAALVIGARLRPVVVPSLKSLPATLKRSSLTMKRVTQQ